MGEQYLRERGFEKPRHEAEALLLTLLSLTRIDLYLDSNRLVSNADEDIFWNQIIRRGQHEPLQYITGQVDFCGLLFSVSPGVFIPRPETELMVEAADCVSPAPQRILDLCTGSGALAIALAKKFPLAFITAVDCAQIALDTARFNQRRHQVNQITFLEGDLFSALTGARVAPSMGKAHGATPSTLRSALTGARVAPSMGKAHGATPSTLRSAQDTYPLFDLIVCNPPYIAKEDWRTMDTDVLEHEPPLALFSEDNGLAHIKRVLTEAPLFLSPSGTLMVEIGIGQSKSLIDFIKNNTPFTVKVIKDFSGIDRILICTWTK